MDETDYQNLLEYWFAEPTRKMWFNATPEFDQQLRHDYLHIWQAAKAGQLNHWQTSAAGALALVIVLDQFPLNMFRGQAESFSTEAQSREVAAQAIAAGLDQQLNNEQKPFLYLPYMHSEDIQDQNRSVELFQQANLTDNVKWAKHHRDIVQRFGRFPHRNAILNRSATDEEVAYLNSEGGFKG